MSTSLVIWNVNITEYYPETLVFVVHLIRKASLKKIFPSAAAGIFFYGISTVLWVCLNCKCWSYVVSIFYPDTLHCFEGLYLFTIHDPTIHDSTIHYSLHKLYLSLHVIKRLAGEYSPHRIERLKNFTE